MVMTLICIGSSVLTSVIVTNILATHYFEIVNGYVDEMIKMTKEFVESMKYKR